MRVMATAARLSARGPAPRHRALGYSPRAPAREHLCVMAEAKVSPYSTRFKIVAAAIVAVAIAMLAYGCSALSSGNKDPVLSTGDAKIVDNLIPRRNSEVPQQSDVGIDLAPGWTGTLVLNGVEIPKDELQITPELGVIEFTPGKGKAVEHFRGGQNCVQAIIWRISDGRGVADRTIPWCFEVV